MKKARLLIGRELAEKMQAPLAREVQRLKRRFGKKPVLTVIRVGRQNHAQLSYLRSQQRLANRLDIGYRIVNLQKGATKKRLLRTIKGLNKDTSVSAVLIFMPLPRRIDVKEIVHHIMPSKDAEGMHSENLGRLVMERDHVVPPTPGAIVRLLKSTGVKLAGKEVVVVGHSQIVGRPLALMLLRELATTTVCHIGTWRRGNLSQHTRRAEVLIVAVGKAELIPARWIRKGAIVIDVGMNQKNQAIRPTPSQPGLSPSSTCPPHVSDPSCLNHKRVSHRDDPQS